MSAEDTDLNVKEQNSNATFQGGYQDFSMEREQGEVLDESFPVKLHYMLADLEIDGLDYICSWSRHGR